MSRKLYERFHCMSGLEDWDADELPVWACITSLRGKKTPSELRETTLPLARGIMGTSLRDWSRSSTSYSDSSARKLHTNSLASFFRSCSEQKRQTYDHKTADQTEVSAHNRSRRDLSWAGRAARALWPWRRWRWWSRRLGDDERPARLAVSWRDSTAEQDAGKTDSGFCTDPLLQSRPGSDGPDTRRAGKAAWTQLGPLKREASVRGVRYISSAIIS